MDRPPLDRLPHVVIIGGGFGGLTAAKSLAQLPVRVTLVDRANHHLFQPLLYQVAMAGLSPADIAAPIRSILSEKKSVTVLMGEVKSIDLARKSVALDHSESLDYDFLIIAAGAKTHYYGHDEWERVAPGLKSIDDAIEIRRRVLLSFEEAERETDMARRRALMTFVIIGGGPTGVELAGAVSELSRHVLARDFRSIDPTHARVILVEAGSKLLASFGDPVPEKAAKQLTELGVEVLTNRHVTGIDESGVTLDGEKIAAFNVVWGAGIHASPLAGSLGVPVDRTGRLLVEPDLSLPNYPNAFAIGDIAAFMHQGGSALPGVSAVAMQQARAVAKSIDATLKERPRTPFRYFDKGSMATIGRSRAVAQIGELKFTGLTAWLLWLLVHLWFLIGFRSRFVVLFTWAWSYFTYKRGARIITGDRPLAESSLR